MRQLTILVAPISAVGHVNACVGTTLPLLERGHRVVFFIDEPFRGKLADKGFEEFIYTLDNQKKNGEKDPNPAKQLAIDLLEYNIIGQSSIEEKLENMKKQLFVTDDARSILFQTNEMMKEAIDKIKPDCFYVDNMFLLPAIYYSGIPWVKSISTVPTFFMQNDELLPGAFGMPMISKAILIVCCE